MAIGTIKVQGKGPSKAKIMVVGEAPGRNEELERSPFVGAAGTLLRDTMRGVGLSDSSVYFTNLCKYRPEGNDLATLFDKRGVPDELILEGMKELKEEISAVDPNVIVAVGNFPLWALTGKARWNKKDKMYTGISDWRGSIIPGKGIARDRKVVASYHPAAILRKYSWLQMLSADLRRASEQSAFPEIRPLNKELFIDPQGEDRDYWRDRLGNAKMLTFDIEQIGSDLLCIGFTDHKDHAVTIRTRSAYDIAWCRDLLLSGIPLNAQNGIFDCAMLEYWHRMPGLIGNLKHDTMIASHAAYIELPKDLGFLCSIYTEQPCYWTNINWTEVKKNPKIADQRDFMEYNAIDTWVTHDVMEQQLADELQEPAVKSTFDFEMGLLNPLWKMSKRGVPISRERIKTIRDTCEKIISENAVKLKLITGLDLNVASNPQVAKLLYNTYGFKPVKMGKVLPSADDKSLAALQLQGGNPEQKAVLKLIRETRKNRNLISKFTDIEFDADSRMRCHYKPAGTVTGRLSSSKFFPTGKGGNLQNIPRDKRVRSVFYPQPGKVFFYNDLERAESLVVAKLTGDPLMLRHHAPGADAHTLLAMELFDKSFEEITPDERYMGKQTRHAGNYMQGPKTFMDNVNKYAEQTGVSIDFRQAKQFIAKYRSLHPYLGRWWNSTERALGRTRTLYNICPHRRMRRFFGRIGESLPEAVAYVPQSTVGDALNIAIERIDRDEECRDYGVEMLLQVHDAIGGDVDPNWIEPAMLRVRDLMRVELTVPETQEVFTIPVELAFGPTWGEVKKWEPVHA